MADKIDTSSNWTQPTLCVMSKKEFTLFSDFIYDSVGIMLPIGKKTMLQARLNKRLRSLKIQSFMDYYNLLKSGNSQNEFIKMVDAVTTNKTDFFREPNHFDYLVNHAIPELRRISRLHSASALKFWSAGCSSGEEPYTLSMILSDYAQRNQNFKFTILATDISTDVLNKAKRAVYEERLILSVPVEMKKKYILRSKDRSKSLIRIAPEIRQTVAFQRLNFMDHSYNVSREMDVIFCRNVIIYFDRETQEKIINRFYSYLRKGGYLFLGHSESLHGLQVPLIQVAPTIYRRSD